MAETAKGNKFVKVKGYTKAEPAWVSWRLWLALGKVVPKTLQRAILVT